MKKNYYNPEMEISVFDKENVVTASGDGQLVSELKTAGVDENYLTDKKVSEILWTY